MSARRVTVGLIALLTLVGATCGIPEDDTARVIASGEVPFDPDPPPTSTTTLPPALTEEVKLWMVDRDSETTKLREVTREIAQPTVQDVVELLLMTAPDEDDPAEQDLSSAIPPGTTLAEPIANDSIANNNVVVINLTGDQIETFNETPQLVRQVSAQIVFTLSTLRVKGQEQRSPLSLRLQINGTPASVTLDEVGSGEPVTREDYCALDPERDTCPDLTKPSNPSTTTTTAQRPNANKPATPTTRAPATTNQTPGPASG